MTTCFRFFLSAATCGGKIDFSVAKEEAIERFTLRIGRPVSYGNNYNVSVQGNGIYYFDFDVPPRAEKQASYHLMTGTFQHPHSAYLIAPHGMTHSSGSMVIPQKLSVFKSNATFYSWRSKYGGMDVAMIPELKALQEENLRLKKMYAEVQLQSEILQEAMRKKW